MTAIMLDTKDNVAVVLQKLVSGDTVDIVLGCDVIASVKAKTEILFCHKIAIHDLKPGEQVKKYGEVIGRATQQIQKGDHVHVHNVISIRGSASQQ